MNEEEINQSTDDSQQSTGVPELPDVNSESALPEGSEEVTIMREEPKTQNYNPDSYRQQTEVMEVHKHPHHITHKKKWGEYLLEFFMLFLAVFLGFLAENFREREVEKEKGKQYIESFYEDLKNDTARISKLIVYDEEKISSLVTMYNCYDTVAGNLEATGCMGPLLKHSRSNKGFVLTERTIQQLANAGGYRLLNKEDADSITAYENAYKSYLDFQFTVFQSAQDNVRNTLNRMGNFKVIAPVQLTTATFTADTVSGKLSGGLLFTEDRTLLNQWFNELALYLRTINGQRNIMIQLKDRATGLLKFYNNKYHLE